MVGKTSISNRYVDGTFTEEYKTSLEVKFKRKNIVVPGTQSVGQLHIWDTLGQERFKAIAPIFYRRSIGALLVYDCTDKDSFLACESWYTQIKNNSAEDTIVMLVGNKVDKPDKVISSEMGAEYARQKGWGFMEVSAKEDINIQAAFSNLARAIYQMKVSAEEVDQSSGVPNNEEDRGRSISLHQKNRDSSSSGKGSGKKKGGCCK
mmetsp:Transcript_5989/g.8107  ORF Transcript_5989/g.8107 Transcript_5989/m.8107 type:complete len:206 (+) Transcript_5989:98-715(+)|eukprot:CAMPEP_0185580742 /NCGR_PEP_ID=MMETSP0434-20130131/17647_1 /TAXON_ID=626734 ORGANISM="Favella taraikaensis, Strain Fe Narragansett Bay" /NCGR_SAMPLE_ID=MMETSP0434 /ASSEMBLY_ACC=CAM_ASM_000379 /LENGTH=205 /DNA_ID=CAMNT_0028199097 /DNA_START=89 /DNA_END=706 /DNA_ORIENTATION=+